MKKLIAVLLAMMMVFSFAACRKTNGGKEIEKDYISIDSIVVMEEHSSFADCSIKVMNNFDKDIDRIEIEYHELDDAGNVIWSGSIYFNAPGFGQSANEKMQIHNSLKDVDCLEFVSYNLLTSDYKFYESHNFVEPVTFFCVGSNFYIKGTEPEKEPVTELFVGEMAKTDTVELTVKDVYFADKLSTYTYTPTDSASGIVAGDGNIYICIRFDIKNMGKDTLEWEDYSAFEVDYNDGYIFSAFNDTNYSYLVEPDGSGYVSFSNGSSSSKGAPDLLPLSGDELLMIIEVSKMLEEDTESPLKIKIELPSGISEKEFIYNVR
ncbi:MAG: hypothetical protein E7489_03790 [Ruminococcaceae bacterium]|nr:hypothetical protein [Oscillospiraceae bacterium]